MAKLTLTVNDDSGQTVTGDANSTSATSHTLGSSAGNQDFVAFRFTGVTVANAATIRKATLKIYCASIGTVTQTFQSRAEASDNAGALTTGSNDLGSRTYNSGETQKIHDLPDGYLYLDVTASVQAIINRAGWASGNALNICCMNPTGTSLAVISTLESANDPQLTIIHGGSASGLTTFGSNTGSYTNPTNATSINSSYATMTNDTSSTHTFYNFGFSIPTSATIDDIVVTATVHVSSSTSRSNFGMELTKDGGTNWATQKMSLQTGTTVDGVSTHFWGGDPDAWSILPTASEINDNTNFRIRLQNNLIGGTNDPSLDYIAVNVFYTAATTSIKTIKGLAVASVKTVNGLAIASVKTYNGLA